MSGDPSLGPGRAQIEIMGHNIAALIESRRRRRRRRLRVTLIASASLIVLAVTAAGVIVIAAPAEVRAAAYSCFVVDDPRAGFAVMPYPVDLEPPSGLEARVEAALAMCALSYSGRGVRVPDPAVCELADRRLAVFPNAARLDPEEFCGSIGLGPPTAIPPAGE